MVGNASSFLSTPFDLSEDSCVQSLLQGGLDGFILPCSYLVSDTNYVAICKI